MSEAEYRRSKKTVINPYTFIPIDRKTKSTVNAEEVYSDKEELLTGVMHCSLYVKTPLAIPDTASAKEDINVKDHYFYPFTKRDDDYIISGSSIRGMLRNVYETMTESCFATMKADTYLSKRINTKKAYKAGILIKENEKMKLYPAERYLVMVDNYKKPLNEHRNVFKVPLVVDNGQRKIVVKEEKLGTGTPVIFKSISSDHRKKRGNGSEIDVWDGIVTELKRGTGESGSEGILYVGEHIGKKHGESVFKRKKSEVEGGRLTSKSLEEAYKKLLDTLDVYRNESINKNYKKNGSVTNHSGYAGYEDMNLQNGIPVWYEIENGRVHFSPGSIGRTMYHTSLNDLVKEKDVCKNRINLCEACSLFGMIADKGASSIGSRVRVADAKYIGGEAKTEEATLKELGAPRYSYLPFYSRVPKASDIKNMDYDYDNDGIEIAGRKYYWHNEKVLDNKSYRTDIKTKRNSTMELIMPDTNGNGRFTFDIYYDGITFTQLSKLMWSIHLGENNKESSMCHKVGHGKPLGLGSVKVVIDKCEERRIEENGYKIHSREIMESEIQETKTIRSLKKVLNMKSPFCSDPANQNAEIDYPDVLQADDREFDPQTKSRSNKVARHSWYSSNKNGVDGDVQLLPSVDDDKQVIYQYQYVGNGNGSGGNNRNTHKRNGSGSNNRQNNGNRYQNGNRNNENRNAGHESSYSDEGFQNTPFAPFFENNMMNNAEGNNSKTGNNSKSKKKRK